MKGSFETKFWQRVDRGGPDECWPWMLRLNRGYGEVGLVGRFYHVRPHRVAYELLVGPIPDGLVIDHLCRNRSCCNPAHLEPVTVGENIRRGLSGNGSKTHCLYGHPFSGDNLISFRESDGSGFGRACRICKRRRDRERSHRRRQAAVA